MAFVIAEPCSGSKEAACVEVCPVDCIHTGPGEDQYFIDPSECINCAACMDVCPVNAIYSAERTPPQWVDYAARNARFFETAAPE